MKLARIHRRTEPIWHVQLAILAAIAAQVFLGQEFVVGPHYALAAVEGFLLLAISLPGRGHQMLRRLLALSLLSLITLTNTASLLLVTNTLLNGGATNGHDLIFSALVIYATNIIVFGLLYWELDGNSADGHPDTVIDFLFPQQISPASVTKQANWQPTFFDYFYVSVTNATAFSPTDTLPLTYRAKALMAVQALTSLATIALVAARAVTILR